jgi:hypothetical protein
MSATATREPHQPFAAAILGESPGVPDAVLTPSTMPFAPPYAVSRDDVTAAREALLAGDRSGPFAYQFVDADSSLPTAVPGAPPVRANTYTMCHQLTEHWTNFDGHEEMDLDYDYVIDD